MYSLNSIRQHILCISCLIACSYCLSQEKILYKQIDTTKLFMEKYSPKNIDTTKKHPAIVFFFGGGWNKGSIHQFKPHANYFSQRGIVCFLVDYRVRNRHKTTPFESLKDAKSAIRFIKENANSYFLDTTKIVASGGSAGGHLAAAAALVNEYNDDSDNLSISSKPNALILFNPAIDNGPGGVGYKRIGEAYKKFSPLHNIKEESPPTIIFSGTKDKLIPVKTIELYQKKMISFGNRCDVYLYEGKQHGFFNYNKFKNYKETLLKADEFLQSLGYLNKNPAIEIK